MIFSEKITHFSAQIVILTAELDVTFPFELVIVEFCFLSTFFALLVTLVFVFEDVVTLLLVHFSKSLSSKSVGMVQQL